MNPTTYQTHALWQAINSIKIGKRFRKDLGDIDALARSINEIGLLHPIVITPDGELLAGQRRLEACKKLGWGEVPVRIIETKEFHEKMIDQA